MALELPLPVHAMRTLLTFASGLTLLTSGLAACESGPGAVKEPPVLAVTSPARSLVQGRAGALIVSGTAAPNAHGDAVSKVTVNGVTAALAPDGSFSATIDVPPGASLIQTVATDANGVSASDTRSVQAGQLHQVGSNLTRAVGASLSADAFAKLSAAAGPIVKGLDIKAMLAPMQPMVSAGGSLANFKLYVDDLKFTDIKLSLVPVMGGIKFAAEITKLDVPARLVYAGALVPDGDLDARVTADKITVAGTLKVAPNGMAGFKTTLQNPDVGITNSHLEPDVLPGPIMDLFNLDSAIAFIASKGAELAMGPIVNKALGALGGPQSLDVLGHKLDMQVAPAIVDFTPAGGVVALDMTALLAGSDGGPGFIYTENGPLAMDGTGGFQLGLSDDLVNELLAELHALGTLNLSMPQDVGVFDTAQIQMTVPPMISADTSDGAMRVMLGDMYATFTNHGTPVGKAAINAKLDLKISPTANGTSISLQLGQPEIHVDALDDIMNTTGLKSSDLEKATAACIGAQIDAISKLLGAIPVPAIAGLAFRDLSIDGQDGYVMISAELQ
jgi:hypothetical protein